MRIRDLGYSPGTFPTGPTNSILDVKDVSIGQVTVDVEPRKAHKGVTIILPRKAEDIQKPCFAAIHTLNGNGEVTGSYQIKDWGYTNTPIALTNSISLGVTFDGIWSWLIKQKKENGQDAYNFGRHYGTPVVGETCDWWLNDIESSRLETKHMEEAFEATLTQKAVKEGSYGGGAGMTCHQFKGGTGTSSRLVPAPEGGNYTVGVIVQSNYGFKRDLHIGGVPIGRILIKESQEKAEQEKKTEVAGRVDGGSIVIVVITDAPFLPHQLDRLARHAGVGLCRVAGHGAGRTFSGDIFLALSTAPGPQEQLVGAMPSTGAPTQTYSVDAVKNESIDPFFYAVSEATEEAILNSMVGARDGLKGHEDAEVDGLPVERVAELLKRHLVDV